MTRAARTFALALACALLTAATAAAATGPRLLEGANASFPQRAWVLTLPQPRDLLPGDVSITENGNAVSNLTVTPAGASGKQTFGVVLAIDSSASMHGPAIASAMKAARAFVAFRRPNQKVGVVFFDHDARVALAPTADAHAIDTVLAHPPVLNKGTRIYDGAAKAIGLLQAAHVAVGTVVMLSDGADVGSTTTPQQLGSLTQHSHMRIYTVGLRSPSFSSATLQDVARIGGGEFTLASAGRQLQAVYAKLGAQLANEYLVTYRSLAPAATEVNVQATVRGYNQVAVASYGAPAIAAPPAPVLHAASTASISTAAILAIALIVAAMLGIAVWLALMRPRRSVAERVGDYGDSARTPLTPVAADAAPAPPERTRRRSPLWARFAGLVELSNAPFAPRQLALGTLLATGLLMYLVGAAAHRPAAAFLLLLTPIGVLVLLRARVQRRRAAFADQLADTLQVLASAMRAGHSFGGALAVALEDAQEPTRSELGRVVRDEALGVPVESAMSEAAARMDSRELEHAGVVAALQRESGGNTAEVVDRLVDTIRERDELRRLVTTLTAQGRLGGLVLTLMPIGLAFMLTITSPNYFTPMLHHSVGKLLFAVGGAFIVCGWLAIRKIVDVKV